MHHESSGRQYHSFVMTPRILFVAQGESENGQWPLIDSNTSKFELPARLDLDDEKESTSIDDEDKCETDCIYQGDWQKSRPVVCNNIHEISSLWQPNRTLLHAVEVSAHFECLTPVVILLLHSKRHNLGYGV